MSQGYIMPPVLPGETVENLVPEDAKKAVLLPETPVLVLNRSRRLRLVDKFDGKDYALEPGRKYLVPYGAARHFQARLIVPGTRTMEGAGSYLGILGVDPPEACTPFDDGDENAHAQQVEGLDATALDDPSPRKVIPVAGHRGNIGSTRKALVVEGAPRTDVLSPAGNLAAEEQAAAAAEGWTPEGRPGGGIENPEALEDADGAALDIPQAPPLRRGKGR